jgi:predicted amidohydrolase
MNETFRAACVQMRTGLDVAANVAAASTLICEAKAKGAHFAATPEMTSLFEAESDALFTKVREERDDEALKAFRALAEELTLWLLIGSLPIKVEERRCANRSFLIDPKGAVRATYDKIHMFDVDLPGGEVYRESKNYRPGERAVVANTPWGKLGLSVCYDLRFPHLFRTLAKAGASFLSIPAAFTYTTGQAHWHVLQRARAIETGCFVIAPAQAGKHENGRHTFGHSVIVDPWGHIIAEGGDQPGVITADIDPTKVAEARSRVPALTHDRDFKLP